MRIWIDEDTADEYIAHHGSLHDAKRAMQAAVEEAAPAGPTGDDDG